MTAAFITPAFRTAAALPFRPVGIPTGAMRQLMVMAVAATVIAAALPVAVEVSSESSVFHPQSDASPQTSVSASNALAGLAPRFEVNAGQFDPAVRYVSRGSGYTLFLTSSEAVMDLAATANGKVKDAQAGRQLVRMGFAGANATPVIEATEPIAGVTNYLKGNDPAKWTTGVQSFTRLTYKNLYPGVDLLYRGNEHNQLEYDFVVAAAADPGVISLTFSGHDRLEVSKGGDLVITTAAGKLVHDKPFIYQEDDGRRDRVHGAFVVDGDKVSFRLGDYDTTKPLVIDPTVAYSTYLGGLQADEAAGVATDANGNVYVTGKTCSLDFAIELAHNDSSGGCDAFVAKLSPDGSELLYATYLGGPPPANPVRMEVIPANPGGCKSLATACTTVRGRPYIPSEHRYPNLGVDAATGIAVGSGGTAYVTGYTHSGAFPTTSTAFDRSCGTSSGDCPAYTVVEYVYGPILGGQYVDPTARVDVFYVPSAFLAKLSPDGSRLEYSTYLGGGRPVDPTPPPGEPDYRCGPHVNQGCARPYPETWNTSPQPPGTVIDYDRFEDSTSGGDLARGIALDGGGNAYLTGVTSSGLFPTTDNAQDRRCGIDASATTICLHDPDVFIAKIDTRRSGPASLAYSSYLGGGGPDKAVAIAVGADPSSAKSYAYITGSTDSAASGDNFPTTPGVFSATGTGFLAKVDPDPPRATGNASGFAPSLTRSTLLGPLQRGTGVAVDLTGNPYVTGTTSLDPAIGPPKAPVVSAPLKPTAQGGVDVFVMKLSPDLSGIGYFTYMGGAFDDVPSAIATDSVGKVHLSGYTTSQDFPTRGPFQSRNAGNCTTVGSGSDVRPGPCQKDAFVATLNSDGSTLVFGSYLGGGAELAAAGTGDDEATAIAVSPDGHISVVGKTASKTFPGSDGAVQQRSGGTDAFVTGISSYVGSVAGLNPARGPSAGGTAVTISGTGFAAATGVRFGDVAVPFKVISDTEMSVTSPPHPDPEVFVRVYTAAGPLAAISPHASFTYEEGLWTSADGAATRNGHVATLLDHPDCHLSNSPVGSYPCGHVFVFGGTVPNTNTPVPPQLFDPKTGAWRATVEPAGLPVASSFTIFSATLLTDGRVLVTTGSISVVYDPQNGGSWTRSGDMMVGRGDNEKYTATRLDGPACNGNPPPNYCGNVLVVGGRNNSQNLAEIYDPDADDVKVLPSGATQTRKGKWSLTTPPPSPVLEGSTATLLGGPACQEALPPSHCGRILVTGTTGLVYDPGSQEWTSDSPAISRSGHSATVLPDGKVLLAGGTLSGDGEIYDPAAATGQRWSATYKMNAVRSGHVAALLPNTKVLLTAGSSGDGRVADLYIPGPGSGDWRWSRSMLNLPTPSGATATLLSSRADRFEAIEGRCGRNCGKVLVIGSGGAELYTPAPSVATMTPDQGTASGNTVLEMTGTGFWDAKVLFDRRALGTEALSYGALEATTVAIRDRTRPEVWVTNDGGPVRVTSPFRYMGAPGPVGGLDLTSAADKLQLSFLSAGSVANAHPAATAYQLRRSRTPILTDAGFGAADVLSCASSTATGDCLLEPTSVGQQLSVTIDPPPLGRTRFYAVRAINEDGEAGPFSTASYTSPGTVVDEETPPTLPEIGLDEQCPALGTAASNQLTYPAGYSLVGLPPGTVLGANSPLYSWLNQGAGGNYTTAGASTPTEAGLGYWAWFSCPKLVQLAGGGADSVTLSLGAYRASMVGNPSAGGPVTATGHDFAARWDPSLNAGAGGYHLSGYRQAQELAVGEGMWAFSYAPTELSIRRR